MASANTTRCPISAGGDSAVITNSTTPTAATMPYRRPADMCCLTSLPGSPTGATAAVAGAATGAADTDTGGGGQVFSPSRTTVIERWTTSSKSSTSWPSLSGVSSFIRLTRLVP